ncbi:MAG TPA: hypothetical protein PLW55_15235, partial [Leptospiraceae bacterium]|nr:hypothetical protein [Leptospiraceae bacterium]
MHLIQRFAFPFLVLFFSLIGSSHAQSESNFQPLEQHKFAEYELYHYHAQLFGGWGPGNYPLIPMGVRIYFIPRTFDYPCCQSGVFLSAPRQAPHPSNYSIRMDGFTGSPQGAEISLEAYEIGFSNDSESASDRFPNEKGMLYGGTWLTFTKIARVNPLLRTPESDPNTHYLLRFQVQQPDFSIRLKQMPFQDFPNHPWPDASEFRDYGYTDEIGKSGMVMLSGRLLLSPGLPRLASASPWTGPEVVNANTGIRTLRPAYALVAKNGWQSHYDLVARLSRGGSARDEYRSVKYMNFEPDANHTVIRFTGMIRYGTQAGDKPELLGEWMRKTTFSLRKKPWGSLMASMNAYACVRPECEIKPMEVPSVQVFDTDAKENSDSLRINPDFRLGASRYLNPNVGPYGDLNVPARLSFRLRSADGGALEGVSLEISASKADASIQIPKPAVTVGAMFHKFLTLKYDPNFDPPMVGQIVPGFPARMEARQMVELDDAPGVRYKINCTVVIGSQ